MTLSEELVLFVTMEAQFSFLRPPVFDQYYLAHDT